MHKVGKETLGVRVIDRAGRFDEHDVKIFLKETACPEAEFAFHCIERWGMVAGQEYGEDSAGRQKIRLLEPDELVRRAFTIANLAFIEARSRKLLIDVPDLNEINAKAPAEPEQA